jgi:tRNA pseudouridine55 synthase
MDGILLINKEIGVTSRDVVNKLMKKFNTKKMGHTGTLDPFASGLMIVSINKGTKISQFMENLSKEYIARVVLGSDTDTLDLDGSVINSKEMEEPLDKNKLLEVISHYIGNVSQIPPMYSALKVNGVPLYKMARNGEEIERKARDITIDNIELLSMDKNSFIIDVNCSKGTYIRTLGVDIAHEYGYPGHLELLTRTRVGKYLLKNAKTVEEVTENDIISISDALSHIPSVIVEGENEKKVRNGVALRLSNNPLIVVKTKKDEVLAIYQISEDGKHHCLRGLL